jgi:hypothetical protein
LKIKNFASGGNFIFNLLALRGSSFGLRGLDKTWIYATKKLQTMQYSEGSQLGLTFKKIRTWVK